MPPSPLDRILSIGSRVASAALGFVSPRVGASAPFSGAPQSAPDTPTPAWATDQPPPPPRDLRFDPAYHGHTYKAFTAPYGFGGWTVDRVRSAIETHDNGIFLESSLLCLASTRFGPVAAALGQAIAPALALPRQVHRGTRGIARLVGEEVEAQLAPRAGLMPSPYFPPTLWGSASIDLRLMGFAVLQHVYGDEDPETGVRPIYTRRWPTWAVQYYRYRRTYVAITSEGPVDIISGDGKFTLIADEEEPHFNGAIRALGLPLMSGILAAQARDNYIDLYGNPKPFATMPEKIGVRSEEGQAFFEALQAFQNPGGLMLLPFGSTLNFAELSARTSTVFKDADELVWRYVAAILLGSDGTMVKGGDVYSAPIYAGVRRDMIARMLSALVRGVNQGHVAPWLLFNYAATIEEQRARGLWVTPVLDIPLPDPDADKRIESYADRLGRLHELVRTEREAGFIVTQERVNQIAEELDVEAPTLAEAGKDSKPLILAPSDLAKVVRVDEARERAAGLSPIGDERGELTIAELDALSKAPTQNEAVEEIADDNAEALGDDDDPGDDPEEGSEEDEQDDGDQES